ncbi:rtf2 homolog [Nannochloropsis oceanica]
MGNDGGVLAMQRKYMRGLGNKMGEKPSEEMNKRFRALIRSRVCAVSSEALRDPIVACELGHLYNKEAVLLALLERTLNPAFAHIRGMKDLIPCRLTINPNWTDETAAVAAANEASASREAKGESKNAGAGAFVDEELTSKYICPVARVEMNAKQPFVVIRSTGWVLSERALKEIGEASLQDEYGPFDVADDLIQLVPDEEEENRLRRRMNDRRSKAKKERKRKQRENQNDEGGKGEGEQKLDEAGQLKKKKKAHKVAKLLLTNGGGKEEAGSSSHVSSAPMGLSTSSLATEAQRAAEKEMASSSAFASLFDNGNSNMDKNSMFSVRR